MNLPINTSQTRLPATINTPVDGAAGTDDLREQTAPNGELADQDWFSAKALTDGKTIEAGRFDDTANRMSVEEAANRVYSRIVNTAGDAPWK